MKKLLLLLAILLPARGLAEAINIGDRITFHSKFLAEDRPLLIGLPRSYSSAPELRYPVLYVLDGEEHFRQVVGLLDWQTYSENSIPEHIVIGIPNLGPLRRRDLNPAHGNRENTRRFFEFLSTELIPFIDGNYRTHPFRILAGHSLAGAFTVMTLLEHPRMFRAYIAASPFLTANPGHLVKEASERLGEQERPPAYVFTSLGNEKSLRPLYDEFVAALDAHTPEGMQWANKNMPDEVHMSTPPNTFHVALTSLYSDLKPTLGSAALAHGVPGIRRYFSDLAASKYRYQVPAENAFIAYAVVTAQRGDLAGALEILSDYADNDAQSWQSRTVLAKLLEAAGRPRDALAEAERAVRMTAELNHPISLSLQGNVAQLETRLVAAEGNTIRQEK